jgi:hypothetical protein
VSQGADQARELNTARGSPLTARLVGGLARASARSTLWYAAVTVALIGLWDGRFLLSQRIGIWDWDKEAYGLEFLKSALNHGSTIPLSFMTIPHEIENYPALFQSVSYWGNPEVLTLSPFLIFLPWTSVPVFLKIYFFAHLLIAAAGMFFVGRKLGLRTGATVLLFVLLILNPWLLQHLAIGYAPWITICYAPLVIASLLGRVTFAWFLAGTLADSFILYEGGLHVFLWLNATIVLMAVALAATRRSSAHLPRVGLVLLGTTILTIPKVVAIHGAYGHWHRPIRSSYGGVHDLWGLLTDTKTNLYDLPRVYHMYGTAVYDGAMFTPKVFLAAVVALAALLAWRTVTRGSRTDGRRLAEGWALLSVAAVWFVLGWDGVWPALTDAIGALGSEIYPFRFLALSVFLCAAFLTLELDRLRRINTPLALACLGVALAVAAALWSRNDHFAKVAVSMPYTTPVWHPPRFLDDSVTARIQTPAGPRKLGVEQSLKSVSIDSPPSQTDVRLDWLPIEHLHDFTIRNAHVIERDGLGSTIAFEDLSQPTVITPHAYHRGILLLVSVLSYGLVLGFLWGLRSPRRSASERSADA